MSASSFSVQHNGSDTWIDDDDDGDDDADDDKRRQQWVVTSHQ